MPQQRTLFLATKNVLLPFRLGVYIYYWVTFSHREKNTIFVWGNCISVYYLSCNEKITSWWLLCCVCERHVLEMVFICWLSGKRYQQLCNHYYHSQFANNIKMHTSAYGRGNGGRRWRQRKNTVRRRQGDASESDSDLCFEKRSDKRREKRQFQCCRTEISVCSTKQKTSTHCVSLVFFNFFILSVNS